MGILNRIIGGVMKMFSKDDIKQLINENPILTDEMVDRIELWKRCYNGRPPWENDYIKSTRIEKGICREFADVVVSEMDVNISNDKLAEIFNNSIENLNEFLQDGLAMGSFCIKPLGNGESEIISADNFIPIRFTTNHKPADFIFIDRRKIDDKYYIRLERHSIREGFLRITNRAYVSSTPNRVDRRVGLDILEAWAMLPEDVAYPGMKEIDFGYYVNPEKNHIDGSPCGVSIFDSAIDTIKKADVQRARLEWEFESGERAIHVSRETLIPRKTADGRTVPGLSKLNKRLYRGLEIDADGKEFIKEFSPDFRDTNIINGLEKLYRQIEFIVGLGYGDLSDTQQVEKTATEIKASKQRKYNRVNAIQKNLKNCLEDFARGLAFHEGLYTSGYEFVCVFNDSILTDEDTERENDRKDVAMGVMSVVEYRMKWFAETREEAERNIPDVGVSIE